LSKLTNLRKVLNEEALDAILITSPINRRYLTNFTGTAGVAIISEEKAIFITDFRYTEQAEEQIADFEIVEHTSLIHEEIHNQLKQHNIQKLGFEQSHVTFAQYTSFKKYFDGIELVPVSNIVENLRIIKSDEEIKIMEKAAEIADKAYEHILSYIKPGVKEIDIANELEFYMRKLGATSSSFDIIVASGHRSALPHGVASEKEITSGELVTMDFGALYEGYCSDITRTVAVGEINDQLREIYDVVLKAQELGVEGIKPGMTGVEADALTRDYITEKGYGKYFGHSTGHGLGMEVHEAPGLSFRSETTLLPGMVVTVEPGIYIPEVGGCRIEDDIVITDTGNKRLTKSDKELIIL